MLDIIIKIAMMVVFAKILIYLKCSKIAIDFPVYNIANDPDNKNNKYVFFTIVL